jgi:hypothetical protein
MATIVEEEEYEIEIPDPLDPIIDPDGWRPSLTPTENKIFDDLALYILAAGEKGSGKSVGCLHLLVRHCYEENDALALVLAPQIRTGKEGALYDLQWVLDIWKNGNWKDRTQTERTDGGMGLQYTEPSLDPNTKDRILLIQNRHGGWSKVILISIPYAEVVEKRMKDLSPSFVYVSEITELESKAFFTYVSQQLGRRRGIEGPQQYVASCNPEGPSHWVYEVFFVDCMDADGNRDPDYSVYHVPIEENRKNLPDGYIERLMKLYKNPTDYARLIEGQWIDRPSGEAIFRIWFRPEFHVRPPANSEEYRRNFGLLPIKGYPLILGYDPGPANFSVHFEQMIPCKDKVIWIVFDELNYVGQRKPDFVIIPRVVDRMDYWNSVLGGTASFVHIADESAFTHLRSDGTYDATRIKALSKNRIKLRACPQRTKDLRNTVPIRVQMVISMFQDETLFISATCKKTKEMIELLVSEKANVEKYDEYAGLRPKRSPYLHPFDSMTYPIFFFQLNPAAFTLQTRAAPQVYRAGGN